MRRFGWLCFLSLIFLAGYQYGTKPKLRAAVEDRTNRIIAVFK